MSWWSGVIGCFCRTPDAQGQGLYPMDFQHEETKKSTVLPTTVNPPVSEPGSPPLTAQSAESKSSMKLHPTFTVGNRATETQRTSLQGSGKQTKPKLSDQDFFSSMEPKYKPPPKIVIANPNGPDSTRASSSRSNLGFEVSEVDMEFNMSSDGWGVDDAFLDSGHHEKSTKKLKEAFEW